MAARHSRVTYRRYSGPGSDGRWRTGRGQIQRPPGVRPSLEQYRRSGAHGAAAGSALAHAEAFLSIQTVDPVPPGRLALLAKQHDQPAVAEPPTGISKLAQVAA